MNNVHMYSRYIRFWHWVQAVLIILLIWTGVGIHWPGIGGLGFTFAVKAHRVLGILLIANAFCSLIYHLTSI